MKKNNIILIIGLLVFVMLVGGVSYSFFVYNKDIAEISLNTGNISIDLASINGSFNLTDVIPLTNYEGKNSTNYLDFTVNATVDTENIYYEIYILPKDNNTLNSNYIKVYLTNQNNDTITKESLYSNLFNSKKDNGKVLHRDLVVGNNDGTTRNYTKNYRLRIWIDEDYLEVVSKTFGFDIKIYAYNVDDNFELPVCQRATTLHTETCQNGNSENNQYCYADGYYIGGIENTDTINYGNLKTMGNNLETGDAFDCDTNGNGVIDVDENNDSIERFYYISDYYDTQEQDFDGNTAVLVYYRQFYNGEPNDHNTAYYTTNENWHGPSLLSIHMPSTEYWNNINLTKYSRNVLACGNAICTSPSLATNNGNNLIDNPFSYNGKSSRLLMLKELYVGCYENVSLGTKGSLKKCNFLLEKTKYANSNNTIDYIWLETPASTNPSFAYAYEVGDRKVGMFYTNNIKGIRPVIDVLKSKIFY